MLFGYLIGEWVHYALTLARFAIMGAVRRRLTKHLPFFAFAFAMVLLVHTVFFIVVCGLFAKKDPGAEALFDFFFRLVLQGRFRFPEALAAGALTLLAVEVISHSIRLYTSFLRGAYYKTAGEEEVFGRSFGPVIVPHFIIIFGIAAILLFDAHGAVALIIVGMKFIFDWRGTENVPPAQAPETSGGNSIS